MTSSIYKRLPHCILNNCILIVSFKAASTDVIDRVQSTLVCILPNEKSSVADRQLVSLLLGLLSSLIACIQSHFMLLNLQAYYVRKRLNIIWLLSPPVLRTGTVKRLNRRPATPRKFWVRPGQTSAWWDNFVNQIVVPEEWRENFRVSRDSLYSLAEELRPYIEGTLSYFYPF